MKFEELKALKVKHGHGEAGDRAFLQEALARDDLPPFVRSAMSRAYARYVQRDRIAKHEAHKKEKGVT